MDRIEHVKELRAILDEIDAACAKCSWIGPWGCNARCNHPALREATKRMLEKEGAFVERTEGE